MIASSAVAEHDVDLAIISAPVRCLFEVRRHEMASLEPPELAENGSARRVASGLKNSRGSFIGTMLPDQGVSSRIFMQNSCLSAVLRIYTTESGCAAAGRLRRRPRNMQSGPAAVVAEIEHLRSRFEISLLSV